MQAIIINSKEQHDLFDKYLALCEGAKLHASLRDFMVWLDEEGYELEEA